MANDEPLTASEPETVDDVWLGGLDTVYTALNDAHARGARAPLVYRSNSNPDQIEIQFHGFVLVLNRDLTYYLDDTSG